MKTKIFEEKSISSQNYLNDQIILRFRIRAISKLNLDNFILCAWNYMVEGFQIENSVGTQILETIIFKKKNVNKIFKYNVAK